jgi:hypothetical protein
MTSRNEKDCDSESNAEEEKAHDYFPRMSLWPLVARGHYPTSTDHKQLP